VRESVRALLVSYVRRVDAVGADPEFSESIEDLVFDLLESVSKLTVEAAKSASRKAHELAQVLRNPTPEELCGCGPDTRTHAANCPRRHNLDDVL
jgi:hypothetical protein